MQLLLSGCTRQLEDGIIRLLDNKTLMANSVVMGVDLSQLWIRYLDKQQGVWYNGTKDVPKGNRLSGYF